MCSLMARETGIQSLLESNQRYKKWYLMPPCLTLSIIRYESRVKWSEQGDGVAPSPRFRCCSCWKGSLRISPSTKVTNLKYILVLYIYSIAWKIVCGHMTFCKRQSSGRERKILKKSKNTVQSALELCTTLMCAYVCICVCLCRSYLHIILYGRISDI